MTVSRAIPLSIHNALETIAAPAIMAAPFALGLSPAAGIIAIAFGCVVLGVAVSTYGIEPRRGVSPSAHAGFDYLLAFGVLAAGIAIGLVTAEPRSALFLIGLGAAQLALTTSTRYSAPAGT